MVLMTRAHVALTAVLSMVAVPARPASMARHRWVAPHSLATFTNSIPRLPETRTALRLPNDSLWSECKATQVSGIVTDSVHKGIAGVWVRAGYGDPAVQRVKTDATGMFHVIADSLAGTIDVFKDSSSMAEKVTGVAWIWKDQLQITHCVAVPITIVIAKPRTKEESSITGLWKDCPSLEVPGIVRDLYDGAPRAGVWVQDGWPDFGQRTKTDRTGAFHLTVDKTHEAILFFGDSVIRKKPGLHIGMYEKGQLIINHCVADPINIKVMPW